MFRDWLKNADGKWYYKDGRCPKCLGMGKRPEQSSANTPGFLAVHSTRASHLSTAEILQLLKDY